MLALHVCIVSGSYRDGFSLAFLPLYNPAISCAYISCPVTKLKISKINLSSHATTPLQHQSPLLQQSIVLADHTGMALAWISYPCIIPQSLLRTFRIFFFKKIKVSKVLCLLVLALHVCIVYRDGFSLDFLPLYKSSNRLRVHLMPRSTAQNIQNEHFKPRYNPATTPKLPN